MCEEFLELPLKQHERQKTRAHGAVQGQGGHRRSERRQDVAELEAQFGVSQTIISRWKGEFLRNAAASFEAPAADKAQEQRIKALERKLVDVTLQLDFAERVSEQLRIPVSSRKS